MRSYGLSYENYCTHDGALQKTARLIDSLGFNATSSSALLPNAAVLRTAETVDSIHNAIESGKQTSATASAGYLLCSIVQLGGLIYVLIVASIALLMLGVLSIFNWVFLLLYDTCVVVTTPGPRRAPRRSQRPARAAPGFGKPPATTQTLSSVAVAMLSPQQQRRETLSRMRVSGGRDSDGVVTRAVRAMLTGRTAARRGMAKLSQDSGSEEGASPPPSPPPQVPQLASAASRVKRRVRARPPPTSHTHMRPDETCQT
tara:strand:- start:109 stop:882 length:774 start_codon:yes stop_codon:yes gene_type:complete